MQDLAFLPNMLTYKKLVPEIVEATFKKLLKHKWYLSEETVVFASFSDNPEMITTRKEKFAKRLCGAPSHPEEFHRGILVTRAIHKDHTTDLHEMIGP